MLKGYLSWPYAEQVFRLTRRFRRIRDGKRMKETIYGVTSLTGAEASSERLLYLVRAHWRSPMFPIGSPGWKDDNLLQEAASLLNPNGQSLLPSPGDSMHLLGLKVQSLCSC